MWIINLDLNFDNNFELDDLKSVQHWKYKTLKDKVKSNLPNYKKK